MAVQNSTTTIGTGLVAGTAVGAGAGLAVGSKKAAKVLGDFKNYVGLNADQYVQLKKMDAVKKMKAQGLNGNYIRKHIGKVVEKAKTDFPAVAQKLEGLTKTAKETKNKWLIGLTAAGAAVGTIAGIALATKKAPVEAAKAGETVEATKDAE